MTSDVVVVQARLGSHRLPGKVLEPVGSRTVLEHVVRRCREADVGEVVVARPEGDERLAGECVRIGVRQVAGSEQDVLLRYLTAAVETRAERVVRITADCPMIDPGVIATAVRRMEGHRYLTCEGYPRGIGDVEVVDVQALEEAAARATDPYEREHVTPYVRDNPDRFPSLTVVAPADLRRPDLRVCVDEPADLAVVRRLHALVGEDESIDARRVIELLDQHPDIRMLNAHVVQRS